MSIAITAGVLLLATAGPSVAVADHISPGTHLVTNGQSVDAYPCYLPCAVEFSDPDPGTYRWEYQDPPFEWNVIGTGNPVSTTFNKKGEYRVYEEVESGGSWHAFDSVEIQVLGHGFTINGAFPPNGGYECVAPCAVEVYDQAAGDYQWWFESCCIVTQGDPQAYGNPARWTYTTAGNYAIVEKDAAGEYLASAGVEVIPSSEGGPNDIEYRGPHTGKVGLEFDIRTSRKFTDMSGSDFLTEWVRREGPEGGIYTHRWRIVAGHGSDDVRIEAWNEVNTNAIYDLAPITITSGKPINVRQEKSRWKVRPKGDGCLVKLKQDFTSVYDYRAVLELRGRSAKAATTKKEGDGSNGTNTRELIPTEEAPPQFIKGRVITSQDRGKVKSNFSVTSFGSFAFKAKKAYDCG